MPGSETVVPTPPGLASNGMSQVLLMMALHKGGTRKLKERYELYFNLGVDILTGKNNWEESLVQDEKPHEKPNEKNAHPAPLNAQKAPADEAKPTPTEYKRWTPPEKQ